MSESAGDGFAAYMIRHGTVDNPRPHPNEQLAFDIMSAVRKVLATGGDYLFILNAIRIVLEVEPKDEPKRLEKLRSILNATAR